MESLNGCVKGYHWLLEKGVIQKACRGIMAFMSALKQSMQSRFPENAVSALYPGCMDMTYFASTPPALKARNLKIAVVYLHPENVFEAWLAGGNWKVQAEYSSMLGRLDTSGFRLSSPGPGVDAIAERLLAEKPDFDRPEELAQALMARTAEFTRDVLALLARES